jgi:hypothetical protein
VQAAREQYIARNLSRGPGDPEYTLRNLAQDLGVNHNTLKNQSTRQQWRAEMLSALESRAQAGISAARASAEATEAQIRGSQARAARAVQHVATLGIERLMAKMEKKPETILAGDPAMVRALDRLMRTGLEQEREALGLAKVVELKEQTGEGSPLERLADHREAEALAGSLAEYLGLVLDEE